ncbi:MAG: aminodeoxychorismate synthase component I [Cytophagales bacterium]|nr:aminodeoxychorismate synthase component I [Cytophagales bacterium]
MQTKSEAIKQMNTWGFDQTPFLFFTDFLGEQIWLSPFDEINPSELSYNFNGVSNTQDQFDKTTIRLEKSTISIEEFKTAFDQVVKAINYGDSFLTNLTFQTPIQISGSLKEIYQSAKAKYKIRFKDEFVCFSPETFVYIQDNTIRSFPMKGTIDGSLRNAREAILKDPKEMAEHVTIVDLIRNDLSRVATKVRVERFRYIDEIKTKEGSLLQVSSEIVGELPSDWKLQVGDILFNLLPAGSISGAPKPKTLEIIEKVETYDRGFYTGVCGLFDGRTLDTGVMIRFIEKQDDKFFFKSGGGITAFSDTEKEYQEYQDKIYITTP